jgi:hypothetical protein
MCCGVLLALSTAAWVARRRVIEEGRRESERKRDAVADLVADWNALQRASLAQAVAVLRRLDAPALADLDDAVGVGIRALEGSGLSVRDARRLRTSARLELRYADVPSVQDD